MARRASARSADRSWVAAAVLSILICTVASVGHAGPADLNDLANLNDLTKGDRAWAARAEMLDGDRADPTRIEEAIVHYRAAAEAEPDSLEARWKLLRALHYAIDFTTLSEDDQEARVGEAVEVVRASDALTASDRPAASADVARLLFWSSIAWGTRAQRVGLLTIVREGVAKRMYVNAERSLELDPSVDQGGALRLLSRLHSALPRVPFVSGWVDRDQALPLAEQGYALDPDHPGNRLVLALTLLEREPERAEEARMLLQTVASTEPRPSWLVEDLRIREQARERLAELDGPAS